MWLENEAGIDSIVIFIMKDEGALIDEIENIQRYNDGS